MDWAEIDDPDFFDTFQEVDRAYVNCRNKMGSTNKKKITFGNGGV